MHYATSSHSRFNHWRIMVEQFRGGGVATRGGMCNTFQTRDLPPTRRIRGALSSPFIWQKRMPTNIGDKRVVLVLEEEFRAIKSSNAFAATGDACANR